MLLELERLRPYEREIVERLSSLGKSYNPVTGARGWKGLWIRGYLKDVGEEYVYAMFKEWKAFCQTAEQLGAKIKQGTYQSFRTYLSLLKKLGLVSSVFTEPSRGFDRSYYRLVPERIDDPAWTRPFQTAYPSSDWTIKKPLEKALLRERYKRRRPRGE